MRVKHFINCVVVLFFIITFSCVSDSTDDLINSNPNPDPTEKITYDDDIQIILNNNCTACHGNPTTNSAPFSLTTFDEAKIRIDDIISRINNINNPMPPSGLMPQGLRDNIQKWKDDGLLEN